MAKVYTKITNWDEFPNIKAVTFCHNNATRTICRCGLWNDYCITPDSKWKCPKCGNTEFMDIPKNMYHKVPRFVSNRAFVVTKRTVTKCAFSTGSETTKLVSSTVEDNCMEASQPYWSDIQKVMLHESSFTSIPKYAVAIDIMNQIKEDDNAVYGVNVWNMVCAVVGRLMDEKGSATAKEIFDIIEFFDGVKNCCHIFYETSYHQCDPVLATMQKINSLPYYLQHLAKRSEICKEFIISGKEYLLKCFPKKLVEYILATEDTVYRHGNLSRFLLDLSTKTGKIEECYVDMIIKFMKEKCVDSRQPTPVANFILALRERPVSGVKDYYLQHNIDKLALVYGEKRITKAFADVYNKPAEALISLTNSK